jgi:putative membrane-bound dehydrogenase-like protein
MPTEPIPVLLVVLAVASALPAGEGEGPVPFLTPAAAIEKMTYPEGFRVTAFAAEPDVVQPFAFAIDDRGRFWVAENLNYETRGSDSYDSGPKGRIIILEDTSGDGRFDTRKVFAEKLFFPSGLALGFGGVWVGSPPDLLFIPDADGDDRPDGAPRAVLDGWGRHDRHETLNSFTWGPDGWLYGCHGVFTHSRVGKPGTPDAERVPINAGVWRYHPTREEFEVFAWGTSNPWGLDFDDHGQMFITACVIPHLWHIAQGGRFQRQSGPHFDEHVYDDIKTVADHKHLSAHGGARFYLADSFPEPYRKRLFMCNIHQHAMLTDVLERKGSGFVGRHGDDFLNANDPQWLGFNLEIGPEGAVYVIDWHDADICGKVVHHRETGRIYRIAYEGTKPALGLDLEKLDDGELVKLHLHANDWYVRHARRLLQERAARGKLAAGTREALRDLLRSHSEVPRRLRALWTLHATGGADDTLLTGLLEDGSDLVRAWAVQLLAEDRRVDAAARAAWRRMAAKDPSPVVRLYIASALQRLPAAERWEIIEELAARAEDAEDHNLPLMVWYALEPLVTGDVERALGVAKKAKLPNLARYITRRIAAGAGGAKADEREKTEAKSDEKSEKKSGSGDGDL